MSWKNIVKAKGKSYESSTTYSEKIARDVANDLDFGEGDFWIHMDDFSIDIEVSNLGTGDDSQYPTEQFAIRVKPKGKIHVMDDNVGRYKDNNVIKTFAQEDIEIELDDTKANPMNVKNGAFIFETSYSVEQYHNGKLYVSVEI
tara:strand:- start:140 stop:571 length:432 start_codon:yes stop_codon:yes gene_type:complete